MALPQHLTHKPIVETTNYKEKDEKFYKPTDVVNLSLGFATFDKKEISAKVWRQNPGSSFKRQSEELPLHRVLDLAILIIDNLKSSPVKGAGNIINTDKQEDLENYYKANKNEIDNRMDELLEVINNFKNI
jgi:hypothetical protein